MKRNLSLYLDEDYLNIKPGARNGQRNGLTLLLDVDAFEYELFPKSSKGFIIALSSAGERPMVRQNGEHDKLKYSCIFDIQKIIFRILCEAWYRDPCFHEGLED